MSAALEGDDVGSYERAFVNGLQETNKRLLEENERLRAEAEILRAKTGSDAGIHSVCIDLLVEKERDQRTAEGQLEWTRKAVLEIACRCVPSEANQLKEIDPAQGPVVTTYYAHAMRREIERVKSELSAVQEALCKLGHKRYGDEPLVAVVERAWDIMLHELRAERLACGEAEVKANERGAALDAVDHALEQFSSMRSSSQTHAEAVTNALKTAIQRGQEVVDEPSTGEA